MNYQNFSNQSTSELVYEKEPKYFDFLCFCKHNHTLRSKHANSSQFMNIRIYMINTIYSTNSID